MPDIDTSTKSTIRPLKILLGCYACAPNHGSELGTGWNFLQNIAKYHIVHAIVEEEACRDAIDAHLRKHPEDAHNITFHFIRRKRYGWLKKIWPPSYYWTYRIWQKKAFALAQELDKTEHFDLIHQITLVGYREPGYLWKLGKPFIWGPLGGFTQTARCLLQKTSLHSRIYFNIRNILNNWQKRHSTAARTVSKIAHTIFVADPQGIHDIRTIWNREPKIMREVGTTAPQPDFVPIKRETGTPLHVCWAGQLIPLKALELLLDALPLCNETVFVNIIGDGKMMKKWQERAQELHLSDRVRFHGKLPHRDVQLLMQKCHAFCHTSIKEGGTATVVVEAMQNGLPVLALDHCGHATVINPSCGHKIAIHSRKQILEELAQTLDLWAKNEQLRYELAIGAVERSKDFTWLNKMNILNEVYMEAVSSSF